MKHLKNFEKFNENFNDDIDNLDTRLCNLIKKLEGTLSLVEISNILAQEFKKLSKEDLFELTTRYLGDPDDEEDEYWSHRYYGTDYYMASALEEYFYSDESGDSIFDEYKMYYNKIKY
jgi:hypothetical protein